MQSLKAIYRTAGKYEDYLYKVCCAFGALAMLIAFLAIFMQVLYRYVLSRFTNLPLSFTEELARYCLFWIIYLLLPVAMKQGLEAANTFLPSKLTGWPKTALYLIVRGLCMAIAVTAFIYSFQVLRTNWGFASPVMELPGFFQFGPVVIGLGMVLLRYAVEMIGFIAGEVKPFDTFGKGGAE